MNSLITGTTFVLLLIVLSAGAAPLPDRFSRRSATDVYSFDHQQPYVIDPDQLYISIINDDGEFVFTEAPQSVLTSLMNGDHHNDPRDFDIISDDEDEYDHSHPISDDDVYERFHELINGNGHMYTGAPNHEIGHPHRQNHYPRDHTQPETNDNFTPAPNMKDSGNRNTGYAIDASQQENVKYMYIILIGLVTIAAAVLMATVLFCLLAMVQEYKKPRFY